jgi:serine protease Do
MLFNRFVIPLCLTSIYIVVSIAPISAARSVRAILPKEVSAIGRKIVVRITSSTGRSGSGVIVGRKESENGYIYTVLTAAHVFNATDKSWQVVAPRPINSSQNTPKPVFDIFSQNVQKIAGVDLALVSFASDLNLRIGTIGNSNSKNISEGSPIYIAGFPIPATAIKTYSYQFTGGMVSSRLDRNDDTDEDIIDTGNKGYNMTYTNVSRVGMSGSPIMDAAGRVIGIHGKGDREGSSEIESNNGQSPTGEKTGFNLGIPIQTLLKLQPKTAKAIGARLDLSPVNNLIQDGSGEVITRHRKFKKRKGEGRENSVSAIDVTQYSETTPE